MKSSLRAFEQIQDYLVESARALFDAYGLEIMHVQDGAPMPTHSGTCVAGVLGYASPSVRGCVIVAAMGDVFEHALPPNVAQGPASEACLRDLAGEFANMLLGAIKGKLIHDGVVLQLACPITAIGSAMSLPTPAGGTSTWHTFSSVHGTIHIRFDAQFDRDFDFADESVEREQVAAAGTEVVF
jgi:hypothetical protein